MKLRTGEPWMPANKYGPSLKALTVNLLVKDIDNALRFQREVLGARVVYSDADFAVVRAYGGEWMVHADHTYEGHAAAPLLTESDSRGRGLELRLHGCDPDLAIARARKLGYAVVMEPHDTGHALREAFIQDGDGYLWVPDVVVKS